MYKKILIPLDGSELAECALSHVKILVEAGFVEELTMLNIFWSHMVPVEYWYGVSGYDEFKEKAREASVNYLEDVESRFGFEGVKVVTESLEGGRPGNMIAEYAQDHEIDMIVLATHGYSGLKKMMLGSVALTVLHNSHVPVLLIRPESCRA